MVYHRKLHVCVLSKLVLHGWQRAHCTHTQIDKGTCSRHRLLPDCAFIWIWAKVHFWYAYIASELSVFPNYPSIPSCFFIQHFALLSNFVSQWVSAFYFVRCSNFDMLIRWDFSLESVTWDHSKPYDYLICWKSIKVYFFRYIGQKKSKFSFHFILVPIIRQTKMETLLTSCHSFDVAWWHTLCPIDSSQMHWYDDLYVRCYW